MCWNIDFLFDNQNIIEIFVFFSLLQITADLHLKAK